MSDNKQDVTALMLDMGKRAKIAAKALANTDTKTKIKALLEAADQIAANETKILEANKIDLERAKQTGLSAAFTDRLTLDSTRLADIVSSIRAIAKLDDPVGQVINKWDVPSGLNISRVRTPIGVIGIIYESRPNVTADAAALCLMSGNGAILRGGTDSFNS
ncbi:Gamma-glutamyl phosphate reductase, partial [hydrothermal vent metagenome]